MHKIVDNDDNIRELVPRYYYTPACCANFTFAIKVDSARSVPWCQRKQSYFS